jgi:hypothetical protein
LYAGTSLHVTSQIFSGTTTVSREVIGNSKSSQGLHRALIIAFGMPTLSVRATKVFVSKAFQPCIICGDAEHSIQYRQGEEGTSSFDLQLTRSWHTKAPKAPKAHKVVKNTLPPARKVLHVTIERLLEPDSPGPTMV